MTTKRARDFLDKELFVKRDIVTFRSLSRELGIHVNDAKKELQFYYDAVRDTDTPAVPTYLVSGEVPPLTIHPHSGTQQSDSSMDVDSEFMEDRGEADVVRQNKVLLVDARTLGEAQSQFLRIHSVHIYSLSPSRCRDAGLVCTPSFKVRNADTKGGPEYFSVVGKITSTHVKLRAGAVHQSAASSSKTTLDVPAKVAPKSVGPTKIEQQTTKGKAISDVKEQASATTLLQRGQSKEKPKLTGKLDWSKAKTKEKEPAAERVREEKKPKIEPDSPAAITGSSTSKKVKVEAKKPSASKPETSNVARADAQKRGMKRKPLVDTESESESSSANAKPSISGASIKKGAVLSDEDDDGEIRMLGLRRPKRKGAVTSDSEMSLRAMMDIDDEQVDRVPRAGKVLPQREEDEDEEEDEPEKESDHVPVAPKRGKPCKVVPVGRNGLKKRRVVKSRTSTDAKGYMVTEDYSSYESVDEEEEVEVKSKGKGKGKKTKKASEPADTAEEGKPKEEGTAKLRAKPPPKSRGGASKRGGLLNFFGPERGKK